MMRKGNLPLLGFSFLILVLLVTALFWYVATDSNEGDMQPALTENTNRADLLAQGPLSYTTQGLELDASLSYVSFPAENGQMKTAALSDLDNAGGFAEQQPARYQLLFTSAPADQNAVDRPVDMDIYFSRGQITLSGLEPQTPVTMRRNGSLLYDSIPADWSGRIVLRSISAGEPYCLYIGGNEKSFCFENATDTGAAT